MFAQSVGHSETDEACTVTLVLHEKPGFFSLFKIGITSQPGVWDSKRRDFSVVYNLREILGQSYS